jgi:hypothetical protein
MNNNLFNINNTISTMTSPYHFSQSILNVCFLLNFVKYADSDGLIQKEFGKKKRIEKGGGVQFFNSECPSSHKGGLIF